MTTHFYKIKYPNGAIKVVSAKNSLEVIKKYDLCTRKNDAVTIHKLEGEQLAIAISNEGI